MTRSISWPDKVWCSSHFPLTSPIHFSLLLNWERIFSSKFFNTLVHSVTIEELALPRNARCVLSRFCCSGRSILINSYLSGFTKLRILRTAPTVIRTRTLFISFCTLQLQTLCTACSLANPHCYLLSRLRRAAELLELHGIQPYPNPSFGVG